MRPPAPSASFLPRQIPGPQPAARGAAPCRHGTGRRGPGPVTQPRPVPHELPADVAAFTGRDSRAGRAGPAAGRWERQPGQGGGPSAVVISAVAGTAGVGKTALAVHWAHRVRRPFPGGQLYVNLRGYDPAEPHGRRRTR